MLGRKQAVADVEIYNLLSITIYWRISRSTRSAVILRVKITVKITESRGLCQREYFSEEKHIISRISEKNLD